MNKNSIILLAIFLLSCLGIITPTSNIAFADEVEPQICKQLNLHFGECEDNQPIPEVPCCSEVTPLAWDHTNSAEEISESGSVVTVSGGVEELPITWKVNGNGFYFDAAHTVTEITTDGKSVMVYRTAEACSAEISVSDGCSDVSETVRGKGEWVLVGTENDSFDPGLRKLSPKLDSEGCGGGSGSCPAKCHYTGQQGSYKIIQYFCIESVGDNVISYNSYEDACSETKTVEGVFATESNFDLTLPEFINISQIQKQFTIPKFPPTWTSNYQVCDEYYLCSDMTYMQSGGRYTCNRSLIVTWPSNYWVYEWQCQNN